MSQRERLRELALTVNQGLTAYIAVHNAIFEEAATVKSLFKNLSGSGVPMSKLLEDSEALVPLWDGISKELEDFKSTDSLCLSEDERGFFDVLSRYVEALQKTVIALVERQRLMNEGAQGGRNNPMTWSAYQEKEALYRQSVDGYMTIGEELNEIRPLVFDVEAEATISLDAQCASAFAVVSRTVLDDAHWELSDSRDVRTVGRFSRDLCRLQSLSVKLRSFANYGPRASALSVDGQWSRISLFIEKSS